MATYQIVIDIERKDACLLMPTVFTPNNDVKNDFSFPLTRRIRSVKRFSINNRNGRMVFNQQNFSPNKSTNGWNSRYNNDRVLPQMGYLMLCLPTTEAE